MRNFILYFHNFKFRKKLFISYMVVIIIPIIVLGFYSYFQAKDLMLQQAKQGLSDSIKQVAENINYRFKKYNSTIDFIGYNKAIQQIVMNNYTNYSILYMDIIQQIDPVFNSVLKQNNDISQITIYTENNTPEDGDFIMSADRIKDQFWYKTLSAENTKTNWYYSGGRLFGVRKIYSEIPNVTNLIYIELNPALVFDKVYSLNTDEYGVIIANNMQDIIYTIKSINKNNFKISKKDLLKQKQGIMNNNNNKYILIKGQISDPDWTIYLYFPSSGIAVDAKNIIGATVIIVGICLLILLIITWMFSSTFVKRIEKLDKQIDIVEKGNFGIIVQSRYRDEIGDLTNKFGNMIKNINNLIQEVYQSKITQKEAELKALQSQINPHFLYNTLSIVNWKAIQIDADEISDIITRISTFYRSILNKGKNVISIMTELENIKIYIELQLIMHNESFDIEYNISDEVFKYKIINIVLQPIIENAIEHGIDHIINGERGFLRIEATVINDEIEFIIEDNGPGMSEEKASQILTESTSGYGLKNVHDRLRLFFGYGYGIKINSYEGKGTKIIVNIPKKEDINE